MKTVTAHLDPVGLLIAAAVGVALFATQEGPVLAALAAASVLVVAIGGSFAAVRLWPPRVATPAGPPAAWYEPLSHRESEVAALVADGLSNKEIAERLGIGDRSVETHVQNIFARLSTLTRGEFHSRTQIAVWVKERRMAVAGAKQAAPAEKSVHR